MLRPLLTELVGERSALVVDVGANIGASLLEMRLGAPRAHFVCFEPSRRFRRALERTVAANGWANVRVRAEALGSVEATRTLYVNATTASVVAAAYGERPPLGAQDVEVTTLAAALGEEPRLDFLKVDTDGFDFDVLLGARPLLMRDRPPLFFELDPELLAWGGRGEDAVFELLDGLGYGAFRPFAPGGREFPAVSGTGALRRMLEGVDTHLNVLAL
jgi:FkbM family methyltransferase